VSDGVSSVHTGRYCNSSRGCSKYFKGYWLVGLNGKGARASVNSERYTRALSCLSYKDTRSSSLLAIPRSPTCVSTALHHCDFKVHTVTFVYYIFQGQRHAEWWEQCTASQLLWLIYCFFRFDHSGLYLFFFYCTLLYGTVVYSGKKVKDLRWKSLGDLFVVDAQSREAAAALASIFLSFDQHRSINRVTPSVAASAASTTELKSLTQAQFPRWTQLVARKTFCLWPTNQTNQPTTEAIANKIITHCVVIVLHFYFHEELIRKEKTLFLYF
jgi:hypothetical protein